MSVFKYRARGDVALRYNLLIVFIHRKLGASREQARREGEDDDDGDGYDSRRDDDDDDEDLL